MKIAKTQKLISHLQRLLLSSKKTVTALEQYAKHDQLPAVMAETLDRALHSLKQADQMVMEAFTPLWQRRGRSVSNDAAPTSSNAGNRSGTHAPRNSIKSVVAMYERQFPKMTNTQLVGLIFPTVENVLTSKTELNKKLSLYQIVHNFRKANPSLALRVRKSAA